MEKSDVKKFNIYWLLPILVLFVLSLFFFISSFLNKSFNKPNNSIYIIGKELNTINNNLVKKIDNNFDDTDSLKFVFDEALSSLNTLLKIVNDNYNDNSDNKKLIINSISSNIYFYDTCVLTLNNRDNLNSSYELNKFSSLKTSAINNYKNLLSVLELDFDFPYKMDKTFDDYYLFLNSVIKENHDKSFNEKQSQEFINNMLSLNKDLPSMHEDLMPAILRIREDERNLSVILDDITVKEENFDKLKSNIVSLSVPEGHMDYYTLISEYLNLYEIYLSNIKAAVIFEYSLGNYEENSKSIDKHYKNAASKRDDVINSYKSYINLFNN